MTNIQAVLVLVVILTPLVASEFFGITNKNEHSSLEASSTTIEDGRSVTLNGEDIIVSLDKRGLAFVES
jgi:hypothetical protein